MKELTEREIELINAYNVGFNDGKKKVIDEMIRFFGSGKDQHIDVFTKLKMIKDGIYDD